MEAERIGEREWVSFYLDLPSNAPNAISKLADISTDFRRKRKGLFQTAKASRCWKASLSLFLNIVPAIFGLNAAFLTELASSVSV